MARMNTSKMTSNSDAPTGVEVEVQDDEEDTNKNNLLATFDNTSQLIGQFPTCDASNSNYWHHSASVKHNIFAFMIFANYHHNQQRWTKTSILCWGTNATKKLYS